MSPRLSSTTKVSPYFSVRGGRAASVAVMVNAASAGISAGNVSAVDLAAVLGDIALDLAVNAVSRLLRLAAYGLALP